MRQRIAGLSRGARWSNYAGVGPPAGVGRVDLWRPTTNNADELLISDERGVGSMRARVVGSISGGAVGMKVTDPYCTATRIDLGRRFVELRNE